MRFQVEDLDEDIIKPIDDEPKEQSVTQMNNKMSLKDRSSLLSIEKLKEEQETQDREVSEADQKAAELEKMKTLRAQLKVERENELKQKDRIKDKLFKNSPRGVNEPDGLGRGSFNYK